MPSSAPLSRRRRRPDDSDSEDGSTAQNSQRGTPFSQASNGSKRVRLGAPDGDEDDDQKDGILDGDDPSNGERAATSGRAQPRVNGTPAGLNEYRAGAIVRVKLTDFVTYTSAEFFPGPRLNMVIGPNGTGKSTLVCAICLGLGWGPQHLGRAKDASEFVKHGCREATIEIELASGGRYRRNPVICRTIKREDNKSTFTVNGNQSTKKKVQDLARSFSIQIDNLCQFLPQDKVSEFAALSPVELLHSTQRAAGGPDMIEWHENLKTLRAEQKRLQNSNTGDRELLANLENRQEMQRDDVERMREREEIKKRLALLEKGRPIPRYNESRRAVEAAKETRKALEEEKKELERLLEPAMRAVNAKKEYCVAVDAVLKQKRQLLDRANTHAMNVSKKMEKADEDFKELLKKIDSEKKLAVGKKEEYKRIQQNIKRLERQMQEEPVEFDNAAYSEQIREVVRSIRSLESRGEEIQTRKASTFQALQDKKGQISQKENDIRNLETQSGQQEEKLRRISPDSYKAWKWLQENQSKFEKEVFGPPIVTCSVKDARYANAMESLLQRTDFTVFTAQCRNDFRKLEAELGKLGLHDISVMTCSQSLSDPNLRPPISDDELHDLGLDGWARDYLAGPEPVLALLCSEKGLYRTPLTLRDISEEQYAQIGNKTNSWVAGGKAYQVTRRREYGDSATSTRVRPVRPARAWTNQPVDVAAKTSLEDNIRTLRREFDELKAQMDEDRAMLTSLGQEHEEASKRKVELEREKSAKQTALTNFRALPMKLAQQQEKLNTLNETMQAIRERVTRIRDEQAQVSIKKADEAEEYADAVDALSKLYEDVVKAEVMNIEAASDFETLQERNSEVTQTLEAKKREADNAVREYLAATDHRRQCYSEVETLVQQTGDVPGLRELIEELRIWSVDQLEAEIDSQKGRLELTHEGGSRIIQEFEERQRRIDKLKEQLSKLHQELTEVEESITEVRGKWEPRLDALVQKISDAFSDSFARIGCAGQVSVDKGEDVTTESGDGNGQGSNTSDFEQWSIRIQVKFREHEQLSVLDSHRQSGGERAVSTIFYLMALQSLSASPFRVVDEINQGMDPRNERMVHGRMVDIACSDDASGGGQYFLITPKLLTDLKYKRGMNVMCILSGEYVPQDYNKVDFKRCVLRMKEVIQARKERSGGSSRNNLARAAGVGVGA